MSRDKKLFEMALKNSEELIKAIRELEAETNKELVIRDNTPYVHLEIEAIIGI